MSSTERTPSDRADVCIVGSGVAGALVAYYLASRGYTVVVLEAGERFDPANRLEKMELALRPSHKLTDVWNMGGVRDRYSNAGAVDYPLNKYRVKGIGGTTLHWFGVAHRFRPKDFEMRTRYDVAVDWPIDYEDIRPYYVMAERMLGVAGPNQEPFGVRKEPRPMPAFPPSYTDTLLAEACESLGIVVHPVPHARNSEPYDGRSPCLGYSTCRPVCPSGAKYSGNVHIAKAEEEGARVIDRVPVQRLEHGQNPSVIEAAVYATPDGQEHRQEARQFVVACGGIETPRLLLLSRSAAHPDGLANGSGTVGRYFMDHPFVRTAGRIDQPGNQNPIGFPTSQSLQYYTHEVPTSGSFYLEFENLVAGQPFPPALRGGDSGIVSDLKDPIEGNMWGDDLLKTLERRKAAERGSIGLQAGIEMLPHAENRVTLDTSTTDEYGNPVPEITLSIGGHARTTAESALDVHRRIMEEMNASVEHRIGLKNPRFGGHHMGTTRMGDDPSESVVDPRLKTHELDNLSIVSSSVFPTGGALTPTLTIAALALRTADQLDSKL